MKNEEHMDLLKEYDRSQWTLVPIQICMCALIPSLREGNGLNLNVYALGESLDSNAAASRLVGEPLLVLGIHVLSNTMLATKPGGSSKQ